MARCIRQLALFAVLAAFLASCKGNGGGSLSRGDLYPNGTSLNGSVVEGAECFYVLRVIKAGGKYTLRTQIAPGGTVQMKVYQSQADYESGNPPITPLETLAYDPPQNDTMHEVVFQPAASGDYVVVLSGTAGPDGFGTLYFYDLRLMSSAPDYLRTLATATLDPVSFTSGTVLINPGSMHVYSGVSLTTAPTCTIVLYSMINASPTATISYPQMFVYSDGNLAIRSLLYSVTSTTSDFIFSQFTTVPSGTLYSTASTTASVSSAVISSATLTSGGPYIMLRGIAQANYSLTVCP